MTASLGCEAPVRIRPGLAAVRVRVVAEPKRGYSKPRTDEYGVSDGPPNAGAYERVDYSTLGDIVIWAAPVEGPAYTPHSPTVTLRVTDTPAREDGLPLYATGVGGKLVVRNDGAQVRHLYSVSHANGFDLGAIPPGQEASHLVRTPGVIELLDTTRSDPVAVIFVAQTPWVRVSHNRETVTFTDLPPGSCQVKCWHPRLPASGATVTLLADQVSKTRVTVGVNALPKIP